MQKYAFHTIGNEVVLASSEPRFESWYRHEWECEEEWSLLVTLTGVIVGQPVRLYG